MLHGAEEVSLVTYLCDAIAKMHFCYSHVCQTYKHGKQRSDKSIAFVDQAITKSTMVWVTVKV